MKYIRVNLKESEKNVYTINNLESNCINTNEFLRIIHSIAMTEIKIEKNKGFTYIFPFNLS